MFEVSKAVLDPPLSPPWVQCLCRGLVNSTRFSDGLLTAPGALRGLGMLGRAPAGRSTGSRRPGSRAAERARRGRGRTTTASAEPGVSEAWVCACAACPGKAEPGGRHCARAVPQIWHPGRKHLRLWLSWFCHLPPL